MTALQNPYKFAAAILTYNLYQFETINSKDKEGYEFIINSINHLLSLWKTTPNHYC